MIFLFPLGKGDTSRGDGQQTHCDGKPLQSFLFLISLSLSLSLVLSSFGARGRGGEGECGWVPEVGVLGGTDGGSVSVYMCMIIRIMRPEFDGDRT